MCDGNAASREGVWWTWVLCLMDCEASSAMWVRRGGNPLPVYIIYIIYTICVPSRICSAAQHKSPLKRAQLLPKQNSARSSKLQEGLVGFPVAMFLLPYIYVRITRYLVHVWLCASPQPTGAAHRSMIIIMVVVNHRVE